MVIIQETPHIVTETMTPYKPTIAILHYASAPTVGGVESTITAHALGLHALGHRVRVVTGAGGAFHPEIDIWLNPRIGSTAPDILALKAQLDRGVIPESFAATVDQLADELRRAFAGCDAVIAHNIPTFNKNLPLTAALERVTRDRTFRLIAWCHDLAWTNPQYQGELYERKPYTLLKQVWENTNYVTVSEARREELAALLGVPHDQIIVAVPGIDPAAFFAWTVTMRRLNDVLRLNDADALLLVPARLTRRKNIELAIRILAETRAFSQKDYRLIVTGPPGPHNPTNPGYLGELLALRDTLDVRESVHFLYQYGDDNAPLIPDDATMANLYNTCDALLFPTLQEGFGIPMLEAGLAGIPIFAADLPPLRATGGANAHYFDPVYAEPVDIAQRIVEFLENNLQHRLRRQVRQHYRWDAILRQTVIPLVNRTEKEFP